MENLIHAFIVLLILATIIVSIRIGVLWERNRQDRQRRRYFEKQTKL